MNQGDSFGPYRIERLLGRGGMGEVYLAYDTVRDRTVALKVLPAVLGADEHYRIRFRREASSAARLTEPHIIPVHDHGEIDDRLFIDMRLVEGEDLAAYLAAHGPCSPDRAVAIITQVAAALDAAHAAGLLHRDIKPGNILITGEPGHEFVYVADFGIARSTTSDADERTATGATVGSLGYIAPERFAQSEEDRRVDVYSLGCLLFELLTGRAPFPVTGVPALINAHLNTPAPRPSEFVAALPEPLDDVVAQAMAKDPAQRFASAGALAAAAQYALHTDSRGWASSHPADLPTVVPHAGYAALPPRTPASSLLPPSAAPSAGGPGGPPARRRRRGGLVIAAAVAAVLAGVGGVLLVQAPQADPAEVITEPLRTPGDNPFMPSIGEDQDGVRPPTRSGGSFDGGTPGLYGGTRNTGSCNPQQMVAFLQSEPEKAEAWAQVQGIAAADIPAYVGRLTPVVLRSDTAVTNHGFRDGTATPFQAVLQAGTAVLVDERGVPRVKCFCGNPLTPARTPAQPRYSGKSWTAFTPAGVTAIQPATAEITEFTMVDPDTQEIFYRTAGSAGDQDRVDEPSIDGSWTITRTLTSCINFDEGCAAGPFALEFTECDGSSCLMIRTDGVWLSSHRVTRSADGSWSGEFEDIAVTCYGKRNPAQIQISLRPTATDLVAGRPRATELAGDYRYHAETNPPNCDGNSTATFELTGTRS